MYRRCDKRASLPAHLPPLPPWPCGLAPLFVADAYDPPHPLRLTPSAPRHTLVFLLSPALDASAAHTTVRVPQAPPGAPGTCQTLRRLRTRAQRDCLVRAHARARRKREPLTTPFPSTYFGAKRCCSIPLSLSLFTAVPFPSLTVTAAVPGPSAGGPGSSPHRLPIPSSESLSHLKTVLPPGQEEGRAPTRRVSARGPLPPLFAILSV